MKNILNIMTDKPIFNIAVFESCSLTYVGLSLCIKNRLSKAIVNITKISTIKELLNSKLDYNLFIIDVNLCDFKKQGITGYDIIYSIKKRISNAKILVYTMADKIWDIKYLVKQGVNGLVYKGSTKAEFLEAITTALKGEKYFCSHFRQMMVENNYLNPDSYLLKCKLNPMEITIIRCAASGMTSKEISSYMKRSINTIMDYRKKLFLKFGVNSMEHLLMKAFFNGFPMESNKNIFNPNFRTTY